MIKKHRVLLLVGIVILAVVFRVVRFSQVPEGLNRDEAALGYNAYSLLVSGKDEWGKTLPIVFRSFGDYKLGGYIYTLIPFIKLFGLNAFAVRLPSLLAGLLLPVAVFLFVNELSKNTRFALASSFTTALLPWAIFYSRVGFEANLALLMLVFGLYVLFLSRHKAHKYLFVFLSTAIIFLSFLTYNAPLLLIPFIIVILFMLYKKTVSLACVGLIVAAICSYVLISPAIQGKKAITIFSDPTVQSAQLEAYAASKGSVGKLLSSRPVFYALLLTKNYLATFSPQFLVVGGGRNPWHQAPGSAHLTWSIYGLALAGILVALRNRKKMDILLLALLVISPIPSAITVDAPHATRSLFFLLLMGIFAAYALIAVWERKKVFGVILALLVLANTCVYLQHYFFIMTPPNELAWNTGIDQALAKATQVAGQTGKPITVVGDTHYTYIYPLFYQHIDPSIYRSTVEYYPNDVLGLTRVKSFGQFEFSEDGRDLPSKSIKIEQISPSGGFSVTQTP